MTRFWVLIAMTIASRIANADPPVDAKAAAAASLWAEGKELYEKQDYPAACDRLARSAKLDGEQHTLGLLGGCYEHLGRSASALQAFRDAAAKAHAESDPGTESFALQHISDLEPKIARIVVDVRSGSKADGLVVTLDGRPLEVASYGKAEPIDAGAHVVRAEAPNHPAFTKEVAVVDRATFHVFVELPQAQPPPPPTESKPPPSPTRIPSSLTSRGGHRTIGWVTLSGGLGALATGLYFGYDALTHANDASAACPTHKNCSDTAIQFDQRAGRSALISDVLIGAGLIGAGIGSYLLLTSPSETVRVVPVAGGGSLGLTIDGRF